MQKIRTAASASWAFKKFLLILVLISLFTLNPTDSEGAVVVPKSTLSIQEPRTLGYIKSSVESEEATPEILKIQKFLEKNRSPLAKNAVDFYETSKKFNFDPYLLPAIAGVESSYGQALIPHSHNPFGWNNGNFYFKNFNEAIDTVGKALREKYVPQGDVSAANIGRRYAASWPTWIPKVEIVSSQIENTAID